jgi:hypothetical protein
MIEVIIDGTDRASLVEWSSFRIQNVLSKEPDVFEFRLKNYATKTYKPMLGDEVIVNKDATRIFGGVVVDVEQRVDNNVVFTTVTCKDYTHLLDRLLVTRRYQNQYTDDIIDDIVADFTVDGFTTTGVVSHILVDDVNFNYYYVSDALYKLAQVSGSDWYVDYYKDIHFFLTSDVPAPFDIDETGGHFVGTSLNLTENTHQLRNKIIIRGGVLTGDERIAPFLGDGNTKNFILGKDHIDITIRLNTVIQVLGKEGIDDDDPIVQVWYNPNSGHIRFKTAPSSGASIEVTSTPQYPIIKEYTDANSITKYGVYEFVIVDKTIKSSLAANARARAELDKWGDEVHTGTFVTYEDGLQAGMSIRVNLPSLGIDRVYDIDKVVTRMRNYVGDFEHTVSITASDENSIVDVLADLLINRPNNELAIDDDEVIDLVSSFVESVGNTEVLSVVALTPCWVCGDFTPTSPTDARRQTFADADCFIGDDGDCPS